jgi:two-component system, NtrC family, nitrogen regulation sensor histidine kinase NtrY
MAGYLAPAVLAGTAGAAAHALGASGAVVWLAGIGVALPAAVMVAAAHESRRRRRTQALADGVASLKAGDFSLRLTVVGQDELADLAGVYNKLADALAEERGALRRRELLLDGALEASPAAVVLVGTGERISYANRSARVLFGGGRRLEGHLFSELAAQGPAPLREALASGGDSLVSFPLPEGEETLQVHQRTFTLDTRRQRLVQVRRLTSELRRQEVAGWKKAIRVIGHEVRSHLTAMVSLARSARQFSERGEPTRVAELLEDVGQAGAALQRFIDGYGRFARLPAPRREMVELRGFLGNLARLEPFRLEGEAPPVAVAIDPGQVQQLLMNLLKNSREAGSASEEIVIRARVEAADLVLEVRDRGCGMDAEALARALLPFHTSKPDGSGLGLALCREIAEAHGGWLRLEPREEGGLVVSCRLPVVVEEAEFPEAISTAPR